MAIKAINELRSEMTGVRPAPIRRGRCPLNGKQSDKTWFDATGCTEEEARRKLFRKLLDECKRVRTASKSTCQGDCDESECLALATIETGKVICVPAEVHRCPEGVGFFCYYAGNLLCECVCA